VSGHDAVEAVGWLATVLTLASGLPQVVRLVRTRDAHGVSEWTYVLWTAAALWWAGWGFHIGSVPMVTVNLLLLPPLVLAVGLLGPDRHQVAFLVASPPLLATALAVLPVAAVVAATLLSCLLAAPSVREAFRTEDPSGVAVGTWVLLAAASALWVVYNAGIGYPLVATSMVVQGALSAAVVSRTVVDRRRLATRG
jgi:MtN3 and saliva related transmembrane protein